MENNEMAFAYFRSKGNQKELQPGRFQFLRKLEKAYGDYFPHDLLRF